MAQVWSPNCKRKPTISSLTHEGKLIEICTVCMWSIAPIGNVKISQKINQVETGIGFDFHTTNLIEFGQMRLIFVVKLADSSFDDSEYFYRERRKLYCVHASQTKTESLR